MLLLFLFSFLLSLGASESYGRHPARRLTLINPFGQFWSHWDVRGKVISANDAIRLTPAVKGGFGSIWSKYPLGMGGFGLRADFRLVAKDGMHADGAAIWFVDQPSTGDAYGISSNFTGIGVVLDTYQNLEYHGNSFIGIVGSDGTTAYSMDHNGKEQMLGKCSVPNMVTLKKDWQRYGETISVGVEYLGNSIRVLYKYPWAEWQFCADAKVHIPLTYIMGISASTGELSVRHELLTLRVKEISIDPLVAVTRSTDKLCFEKPAVQVDQDRDELITIMWVIGLAIIEIVVIVAGILAFDYWHNGADLALTC